MSGPQQTSRRHALDSYLKSVAAGNSVAEAEAKSAEAEKASS
jgi:hypothetical protein